MTRRVISLVIGIALLAPSSTAFAQQPDDTACRNKIGELLAEEHNMYRRALFGSTGSSLLGGEDLQELGGSGSMLRTGGLTSQPNGFGIFETPERLTSELVEPIVESYRTFRCRSYEICEIVNRSLSANGPGSITAHPLGCEPESRQLLPECLLGTSSPLASTPAVEQFCTRVVSETLTFERRVLQLAVAYDTGYRSLLQFAGMFDAFLVEVPKRTFYALRQMMSLLGRLHQVPCFTAHCDLPPMSSVPPDMPE